MKPPISNKAVIYCRVSSPEQVKNGHGLTSQETRCREFAKYRNLQVVEVFHEEGISGGLIDRPAITRMLEFLRKQKKEQFVVIIDDISRLARDLKAHIELRMAIQDAGGVLQSPSIEFGDDSDSRLVENLLASVSQHHRQKNAEQVKNRMRARMLGGYWVMRAPRGYKVEKIAGHGKIMVRDEPLASIIEEGLEGYANDRFSSVVELKAFFESQPHFPRDRGGEVHFQRIIDMLNRKVYSGYYDYPEWDIPLMKGKHEAIISYDTYKRIQDKLQGRAKAPARKDLNQDFALRGFVLCDCCGEPLRGCWSAGRSGKYAYYLCHTKNCELYGKSIRQEKLHEDFEKLLLDITPSNRMMGMVEKMLDKAKEFRSVNFEEMLSSLKKEKQVIEKKVEQFLDRIVSADSAVLITAYERQIKQLEEQKLLVEEKIQKYSKVGKNPDEINRTALDFIQNPYKYWACGGLSGKRTVLNATFSRPLVYSKNEGYRTAALSLPFRIIRDLSEHSSELVLLVGLEPTLYCYKQILSLPRLPISP
jgi:site-specific DNA recombinase